MQKIDRREAIRRTALIMGGTLSGSLVTAVMAGCRTSQPETETHGDLSARQLETAAHLAEVILPETDTPGAKDAGVETFVDSMVTDWMAPEEKEIIITGLNNLADDGFIDLSFHEQTQMAHTLLEQEKGRIFFTLFKQVAVLGFFTSEIGATQVLRYDEIPGGYSGCENLDDLGGKTWAI